MINKERMLRGINNPEDRLLVSKMLDRAIRAEKNRSIQGTDFLDPYQKGVFEKAVYGSKDISYYYSGGYIGAERVIAIFRPNFMPENEVCIEEDLFKVLYIRSCNGRGNISHRDYLGSLMGLGIKREKIGDILINEEECSVIVLNDIADYIKYNLLRVSNVKVEVDIKDINHLKAPEPKVKEIRTTVASLRLDSVASAGFGISRSKISDYIKSDRVNLNWQATNNTAKQVQEGDTITIRGKGRVILEEVCGTTKKERISLIIKKFI